MGVKELIYENRAAALSGLSVADLRTLVEQGVLEAEEDDDGLRLFAKEDIERLAQTSSVKGAVLSDGVAPEDDATLAAGKPIFEPQPLREGLAAQVEKIYLDHGAELHFADCLSPELELNRLQSLVEKNEKLVEFRHEQINSLKQELTWLRERIEKLDVKREQDRRLLVSESSLVRQLSSSFQPRRSFLRATLEKLGLLSERRG